MGRFEWLCEGRMGWAEETEDGGEGRGKTDGQLKDREEAQREMQVSGWNQKDGKDEGKQRDRG